MNYNLSLTFKYYEIWKTIVSFCLQSVAVYFLITLMGVLKNDNQIIQLLNLKTKYM